MPWLHKLVPRNDKSLYGSNCASCHGDDLKGSPDIPSLVGVGERRTREQLAQVIRQGTGRMPAFSSVLDNTAVNDLVNFLITGHDVARDRRNQPELPQVSQHRARRSSSTPMDIRRSRRRGARSTRSISTRARSAGQIPFGEYPKLVAQGMTNTGHRQLRRRDRHGERTAVHRRDDVRQQVPRVRQADGQAAVGDDASGGGKRDAVALRRERPRVHRHRVRRRKERRAVGRNVRRVRVAGGVTLSSRHPDERSDVAFALQCALPASRFSNASPSC